MDEVPVVTCLLGHDGRVLLFRRSGAVGSYSGRWGAVSGHVAAADVDPTAPDRDPVDAAVEEIREETGIEDATLVRRGDPFAVEDADRGTRWTVHPFCFDVDDPAVSTDDETEEYEWVHAPEIRRRDTVPDLWTSYDRVRPHVSTVREDATHGAASLSVCALEVLRDEAALAADGVDPGESDDRNGNEPDDLAALARALIDARPSMAVVANRVDRAMADASVANSTASVADSPESVLAAAREGIDRAVVVDEEAATVAAAELPNRVATLSRSGTVREALRRSEPAAVLVAESRPGGEGVGVAETLAADLTDADVTITSDAAFPYELVARDADCLLVGADRILPDGRVVNKVGTRAAALAAPPECPTYVVASTDKVATEGAAIDIGPSEEAIDLEERDPAELYDGDAAIDVANPTFDVTPAGAVDGVFTERGALVPAEMEEVAAEHRERADW